MPTPDVPESTAEPTAPRRNPADPLVQAALLHFGTALIYAYLATQLPRRPPRGPDDAA